MQGAYYQETMGMKCSKNVNPFLVLKALKSVRAGQYLRSMMRRIVPSKETFATIPSSVQRLHYCKVHIINKLWA